MVGSVFIKSALPAVALLVAGAGLASTAKVSAPDAYAGVALRVEASVLADEASRIFRNADLNGDGAIDAAEYGALALVEAELSRLNGFVAIEFNGEARTIKVPHLNAPTALTFAERTRIDAIALREFYAIASGDDLIDREEFTAAAIERFAAVDRDRNGALEGVELAAFAADRARLAAGSA